MTTEYQLIPDRVIWKGPEGSEVMMDEDGICLLVPKRLEQPDVAVLLRIIARAKQLRDTGGPLVPRPPTDDELTSWDRSARLKIAADAIIEKFNPADPLGEVPF